MGRAENRRAYEICNGHIAWEGTEMTNAVKQFRLKDREEVRFNARSSQEVTYLKA